jgi:cell division protein FtsW
MLLGGTRIVFISAFALLGMSGITLAVMYNPNRLARIIAFLNPEKYAQSFAYQLMAALNAFINGGPYGGGLGRSVQKQYYLPEAHTDFIFAIIGEELGVISILVLLLFLIFFYLGLRISYKAPDLFGRLLAFGITLMITLQAAINIGVVIGCLPTKGLPLPFISFGGSSMLITLVEIGILFNIAKHISESFNDKHTKTVRDKLHTV